jgi:hypothetical protein
MEFEDHYVTCSLKHTMEQVEEKFHHYAKESVGASMSHNIMGPHGLLQEIASVD